MVLKISIYIKPRCVKRNVKDWFSSLAQLNADIGAYQSQIKQLRSQFIAFVIELDVTQANLEPLELRAHAVQIQNHDLISGSGVAQQDQ